MTDRAGEDVQSIETRLQELPTFLTPLREATNRYLRYPSVHAPDGTVSVGHRPWVAELNYMIVLYPAITADVLDRYGRRFGLDVPPSYLGFLRAVGGAFCFGMSLYGIPLSMRGDVPLLDRSALQCHDLATATREWAGEYRVPPGLFHFGYRHFTSRENVGYFIDHGGRFLAVKKRGKVVGEWHDLHSFLAAELLASEALEAERHPPKWAGV